MDTVVDRLIRYAKVYSESDYHAGRTVTPSTDRQFDMARLLVEELRGLGIENARYDDKCYVYATLDATPGCEQLPAIGLIAHMDTTPDMTGKDVKPQIIHYTGGDVVLNREQNIVMEAAQFPELQKFVGQDLVCTDGTTLLGADDKAGIAIILQAVEELLAEKAPHGKICLGFTPDEEIGMGASFFDVAGFGADFAYTLDGGDITDYEYETFNAAKTVVTINGFSIHPGTSKDKMRNALLIAMEYNALLPALETPAHTEGYEGFFHLQEMHGKAERATLEYIVRDHDMKRFQERKAMMDKAAEQIKRCSSVHGKLVVLDLRDEDVIWCTNRFMIYALFPQCNISMHVLWGLKKQNTVFAVGKSILDRSSTVNIGQVMLAHGGGGHLAAGTCQVPNERAEEVLRELVPALQG